MFLSEDSGWARTAGPGRCLRRTCIYFGGVSFRWPGWLQSEAEFRFQSNIRNRSSVCQPEREGFGGTHVEGSGGVRHVELRLPPAAGRRPAQPGPHPGGSRGVVRRRGDRGPVGAIAEKAGLGVGTLYRHFPSKEKLCEAILLERLSRLSLDAGELADAADPAAAFFGFLDHVVEETAAKRDLFVAVMGAGRAVRRGRLVGEGRDARRRRRTAATGPVRRCSTPRRDRRHGVVVGRRHMSGDRACEFARLLRSARHHLRRVAPT